MITVNTNMASLIAQKSFNRATNSMNTALNRLSTGLRINSSKDDAAGSAVVTKLDYKINSLDISVENAQMGSSMLDTAEGTLDVIQKNLERIRELTEQAANGTYGDDALKAIKSEVQGRLDEIDRISESTDFNGRKLLDGSIKDGVNLQVGISADENSVINLSKDLFKSAKSSDLLGEYVMRVDNASSYGNFIKIEDKYFMNSQSSPVSSLDEPNYLQEITGEKALAYVKSLYKNSTVDVIDNLYVKNTPNEDVYFNSIIGLEDEVNVSMDWISFPACDKDGNFDKIRIWDIDNQAYYSAIGGTGTQADPYITVLEGYDDNYYTFAKDSYYKNLDGDVESDMLFWVFDKTLAQDSTNVEGGMHCQKDGPMYFRKTILEEPKFDLDYAFMSSTSASSFLRNVDNALENVVARKTEIGAYQQRLSSAMEVSNVMSTNLTAASSLIKDADIAKESANYVKNQILQQTTASLLATANQNPNIALNLL